MSGPKSKRRRNGLTLLIVVISLIVIAAILGGMIQHLLLGKRQSRQWRNHAQATALAESALERAVTAMKKDDGYQAEVWRLEPDALGGDYSATVEINVERKAGRANRVDIVAIYPDSTDYRATVRKSVTLP